MSSHHKGIEELEEAQEDNVVGEESHLEGWIRCVNEPVRHKEQEC